MYKLLKRQYKKQTKRLTPTNLQLMFSTNTSEYATNSQSSPYWCELVIHHSLSME